MSDFIVALLGEPNVGKSSLINALVGENVSIVTDMAGTTREQIRGFADFEFGKVVFIDAPGMQRDKMDGMLSKHMSKSISAAVATADMICYVLDAMTFCEHDIKKIANYRDTKPVIVAVNKTDKTNFEKLYPKLTALQKLEFVKAIIPLSAKTGFNLEVLITEISKLMPQKDKGTKAVETCDNSEDFYTDQSVKKMSEEIIRAAIIRRLHAEIPHGVAVCIDKWTERGNFVEISCDIICEKPSHKPIIIGKNGAMLKQIGIDARKEIETLTAKHIKLYMHIFVRDNWKNNRALLDKFGYTVK